MKILRFGFLIFLLAGCAASPEQVNTYENKTPSATTLTGAQICDKLVDSFQSFQPEPLDTNNFATLSTRLYKSRTDYFKFSKDLESAFYPKVYEVNELIFSLRSVSEQERLLQSYVDKFFGNSTVDEWAKDIKKYGYLDEVKQILDDLDKANSKYVKDLEGVFEFCLNEYTEGL